MIRDQLPSTLSSYSLANRFPFLSVILSYLVLPISFKMSNVPGPSTELVTEEYKLYCIELARVDSEIPEEVEATYFKDLPDAVVIEWANGKSSYLSKDF